MDDSKRNYEDSDADSVDYETSARSGQAARNPVKAKKANHRVKRKKPVDMPRRPLSAYNLFFRDQREKILSDIKAGQHAEGEEGDEGTGGATSFMAMTKAISKMWKELPGEKLKTYTDKALEEKKRYYEEMKEYRARVSAKAKIASDAKLLEQSNASAQAEQQEYANAHSAYARNVLAGSMRLQQQLVNEQRARETEAAIMQLRRLQQQQAAGLPIFDESMLGPQFMLPQMSYAPSLMNPMLQQYQFGLASPFAGLPHNYAAGPPPSHGGPTVDPLLLRRLMDLDPRLAASFLNSQGA